MFHPHKEVIEAWLRNEPIEFRADSNCKWYDLESFEKNLGIPGFVHDWQYRVKKEKYVLRVFQSEDSLNVTTCLERNKDMVIKVRERDPSFKRWVTDWIEYDYA